ncbi:MAG: hypothetical protein GX786_07895 [Clostridiales bacterium]|nr:hypothetical protein [Clostridiales bacterium]
MRKDTSFSDQKLTVEEFSQKYWKGGMIPYQYHTGTIEDGRDEREQFLFNNCRALYDLMRAQRKQFRESLSARDKEVAELEKRVLELENCQKEEQIMETFTLKNDSACHQR